MLEVECRGCYCCCPCRRPWSIGEPLVDGDDVKVEDVGMVRPTIHQDRQDLVPFTSLRKRLADTLAAANGHWSGLLYWSWMPGDGLSEYLDDDEEEQVDDDREPMEYVRNLGGGTRRQTFGFGGRQNLPQSQHRFASGGRLCVAVVLWRLLLVVALLLLDGNVVIVSVLLKKSIPFGKAIERLWSWPCPFRVFAAPRCNLMTGNGRRPKMAPSFSSNQAGYQKCAALIVWGESIAKMERLIKNNKGQIIADVNTWSSAGLDGMGGRRDPNHKGKKLANENSRRPL